MTDQVSAEISGVLFTVDPVTGSHMRMTGSCVCSPGGEVVSSEVRSEPFTFERPKGDFEGPDALRRHARRLYKVGLQLERDRGCPQEVEWAVAGGKAAFNQSCQAKPSVLMWFLISARQRPFLNKSSSFLALPWSIVVNGSSCRKKSLIPTIFPTSTFLRSAYPIVQSPKAPDEVYLAGADVVSKNRVG